MAVPLPPENPFRHNHGGELKAKADVNPNSPKPEQVAKCVAKEGPKNKGVCLAP